MSTPSENPAMPLTATHVETWLITMNQKRFALYARTKEPHAQAVIFWEAADLLSEAIEEIRVISAALRERGADELTARLAAEVGLLAFSVAFERWMGPDNDVWRPR